MLQVEGAEFSSVFKSLPQWLGDPPVICYLMFDGTTLRVRAMNTFCLLEYIFPDVQISSNSEPFVAAVDHDLMAGAFKGNQKVQWTVTNKTLAYKSGKYKGQAVIGEVRDTHFPNIPEDNPQMWVTNLLQGSESILLKKKISTVNPLTVYFRQTHDRTTLCTADGIHFILTEIASPSSGQTDIAIPYTSFQLMMAAFKKSKVPPSAYISDSHMVIRDSNLSLFVPLLGETDDGMNLDNIAGLIAATKAEHTAHVFLENQLDILSAFVDRGKSLKEKDEEKVPALTIKVKEQGLFCKFETSRGSMEDHIAGTTKRGPVGTEVIVDPVAFMDVLTTMASPKVSFLFMPEGRRLGVIGHREGQKQQTGMIIGMSGGE